ncbi:MAG: flagellar hook assembly protein FlgD [Spirochaetaceae bacterium]|jgi:flagellar basal-body rod modification protein FlgD|nr:flagellar hook assembly protein FlgD [Spirochaetaceae bacterium]
MDGITLQTTMSPQDKAMTERLVREHNAKVNEGKPTGQSLGKDDFLKLLTTQLSYQDPMAPMEDKQFIAQMAQFSSLEQMTNMAGDFKRLANMLSVTEANSALGKQVEVIEGERMVGGRVSAVDRSGVSGGAEPRIMVEGSYYQWSQVGKVFE